jgi:RNA polymerase sigma factor (TIGR02999 family)
MSELTQMLQNTEGDARALSEKLLPLVYDELRGLAAARMARESAGSTLQPTALVHEAWLRLADAPERTWENRVHFFRAAALAMRRIQIDRAREKSTLKRAGDWQRLDIADLDFDLVASSPDERLLLIDDSLRRLEQEDPDLAEVVMLKFFTGLSNKETAQTLGVSESTIERRWAFAKVQLFEMIRDSENESGEQS